MSKGNMMLGFARGKVGDLVFARRNGQQIARAYVQKINDAATRGQVEQRSRMGNIVTSYRAYRTLLQRAFESKPIGNTDYNVFASINLRTSLVYFTQEETAAGACVVAPYSISKGTLPSIQVTEQVAGTFTSDIAVPDDFTITPLTTVAQLSEAILAANQDWIAGDQLSLVHAEQWIQSGSGYPMASVRLYEVVLNLADSRLLADFIPSFAIQVIDGFIGMQNPTFVGGVSAIHSRILASGVLKISSQQILLTTNNAIYAQYSSVNARENAVMTRGYNQGAFLNPNSEHGNAGGSPIDPTAPVVSTMTIGGANALTERYEPQLSTGDTVTISGLNLTAEDVKFKIKSGSTIDAATLLGSPTVTATSISGTVVSAYNNKYVQQVIVGNNVLKSYEDRGGGGELG